MSEYYSIYLPNYTIGHGVYEKIPIVCRDYGMSAVIIGGKTALSKAEAKIRKAAEAGGMQITGTLWYGGECTYENVEKLAAEPAVRQAKLLFAVGGGHVHGQAQLGRVHQRVQHGVLAAHHLGLGDEADLILHLLVLGVQVGAVEHDLGLRLLIPVDRVQIGRLAGPRCSDNTDAFPGGNGHERM